MAPRRGLLRRLSRFGRDTGGATAVIYAICVLPLMILVSGSIDITRVLTARAQLNDIADAAVLSAISRASRTPADEMDAAAIKTAAEQTFQAMAASRGVTGVTGEASRGGGGITAALTYRAEVPTLFPIPLGFPVVRISGRSESASRSLEYADFTFLLDVSQSMGLAANAGEMARLKTLTGGCQFACHQPEGSHTETWYDVARANNVRLRIDALRDATLKVVDDAIRLRSTPDQYRMGVYTFNANLNTVAAATSNLPSVRAKAEGIDLGPVLPRGDGQTYFARLSTLAAALPAAGDGSSPSSPKRYLFFISDGVEDRDESWATWGHGTGPLDANLCNAFKSKGYTVAVIYTSYLPMPERAEWDVLVKSYADQIGPRMQSCATPGFFFEAADDAAIQGAVDELFKRALSQVRLSA